MNWLNGPREQTLEEYTQTVGRHRFPLPSFLRPMALTVTLSPVCSRTRFQFQFTRISLCRLMISSTSFDKLFHIETSRSFRAGQREFSQCVAASSGYARNPRTKKKKLFFLFFSVSLCICHASLLTRSDLPLPLTANPTTLAGQNQSRSHFFA